MREALTILGFGPCHHMYEVTENPLMKTRWRALMAGAEPDWPALFEGYRSCVDWPAAFYWRDLAALQPEAKVVLTWRSPESWWDSFEKTILAHYRTTPDRDSVGVRIIDRVFGDRAGDRDHAIALYEANAAAVRREIAPERLIVHAVGDGWGPLCAGLGVAEPAQPYPHRNTAAELRARVGVAPPAD